jgi:hypothetical protein
MAVAKKGFEFFLNRLLKGFRSVEKREPNNLEMILIRQEAGNKAKDAAKVIEVDFGKPFNKEIEAMIKSGDVKVGKADKTPPYQKSQADIEFEIMEKIKSDNEKAVRAFESRNPNPKKAGKGRFTKAEYLIQRLRNTIKDNPDDKYVQETFPGFIKELEANPDLAKNKNVFRELGEDLPDNQKITVFDDDTLDFATLQPTKKFRLNKERFKKDFNVTDEEVEKISILSPEDQQKKVREYIDKDFKERIELSDYDVTDLEPNAEGGRAGYYTGGMIDVEPNLSDIGHGSDSLMARTRLVSPNSQATTSTGLNYLLAEDNDNIRVPFSNAGHVGHTEGVTNAMLKHYKKYLNTRRGKQKKIIPLRTFAEGFFKENLAEGGRAGFSSGGMGRRAFLKLLATLGGATAAAKSGILGLGEGVGKKAVTETIKKSAGSSTPPPYFFELMETITKNGREIKSYGERVRQTIAPSKDGKSELLLTEDLNTGSVQIKKIYKEDNNMVTKSEEMTYTKNMGDETTQGKPADDYEEVTEFNSRIYKDEFNDPDVVDGIDVESIIKEVDVKKASGGIAQMIGE